MTKRDVCEINRILETLAEAPEDNIMLETLLDMLTEKQEAA
jgi:hypothetical protein